MKKRIPLILAAFFFATLFVTPCFAAQDAEQKTDAGAESELLEDFSSFEDDLFADEEATEVVIADPLEPINRACFWLNDKLYFYLMKPIARVYRVVPEKGRVSVSNFFSNLSTPIRLVNNVLQLKVSDASVEAGRFLLNTTVGLGGLFDPAASLGLEKKEEDFGQTLGSYGVGQGFYLVLPFFGSSSLRDGVAMAADSFLEPAPYVLTNLEWAGASAFKGINFLSLDKDNYEAMKEQALDPYLFMRNVYAQRREALVNK